MSKKKKLKRKRRKIRMAQGMLEAQDRVVESTSCSGCGATGVKCLERAELLFAFCQECTEPAHWEKITSIPEVST